MCSPAAYSRVASSAVCARSGWGVLLHVLTFNFDRAASKASGPGALAFCDLSHSSECIPTHSSLSSSACMKPGVGANSMC